MTTSRQIDPQLYRLVFVAACMARDERKARQYYQLLEPALQRSLIQTCLPNIDPRDDAPTIDRLAALLGRVV